MRKTSQKVLENRGKYRQEVEKPLIYFGRDAREHTRNEKVHIVTNTDVPPNRTDGADAPGEANEADEEPRLADNPPPTNYTALGMRPGRQDPIIKQDRQRIMNIVAKHQDGRSRREREPQFVNRPSILWTPWRTGR